MNAFFQARYDEIGSPIKDHRSAEAQLLQKLTSMLMATTETGTESSFQGLVSAISENQKFWQQIALDLADDENGMPDDLRASLLSLAGFVLRYSSTVLNGNGAVEPLIEINRHVIRGLMGLEIAA